MAQLRIRIETDNAAFEEGNRGYEIARILKKIADKYSAGETHAKSEPLYDINGNRCGTIQDDGDN